MHVRRTGFRPGSSEELILTSENRRDRVVREDVLNRRREQCGHRENLHILGPGDRVDRHRIRDNQLVYVPGMFSLSTRNVSRLSDG